MRIVLCDYAGYPFPVELSRALAAAGHRVLHLHFADLAAPKGRLRVLPEDSANFAVFGVSIGKTFDKRKYFRRLLFERRFGGLAAKKTASFRPDVVVGCNMPLDAQHKLQRTTLQQGAAFVFWMQDILSYATGHYLAKELGFAGKLIGRRYKKLEGSLARSSAAVVAISENFRRPLDLFGVPADRISVIPNWAPLSEIAVVPKDNEWARRHNLVDKRVALYTGTLKLMENPGLLLETALAAQGSDLTVVVISQGAGADWLSRRKQELGIRSLILLPYQPIEEYPQVLATGDVLLATLDPDASAFTVPSKVLSYLAAGRPIVASISRENDAAKAIEAAEAGFVVDPNHHRAFVERVVALAGDDELRRALGRNARCFAEKHFAIDGIAAKFASIFSVAASRGKPIRYHRKHDESFVAFPIRKA